MSAPATKRATYQDVIDAPPGMVAQLIDGQLELQPRPAIAHSIAASELGISLGGRFGRGRGGPGGWTIVYEPEVHFGPDVLVPDLAAWRTARLPEIPDEPFFTVIPNWVCEVLSPSTARIDRVRKMRIFARDGVDHVWLIDPAARTLEVYRRESDGWKQLGVFEGDERVRAEPFEAEELALELLWVAERR